MTSHSLLPIGNLVGELILVVFCDQKLGVVSDFKLPPKPPFFSWVQRSRANLPKFWPKIWENLGAKNGRKVASFKGGLKSDSWAALI